MKNNVSPFCFRFAPSLMPGRCVLLGAVLLGAGCSSLLAQSSLSTFVDVGASNPEVTNSIYLFSSNYSSNGAYESAQATQSFTGMDGSGNTQTMIFSGFSSGSATYGQLHFDAGGTVTNTYYNANNPVYYNGNTVNPNGSPDYLTTAAFVGFSDTLQYGGALESGYQARYIFAVDGSNDGYGVLANLSVSIAGNQEFTTFGDPGDVDTTYATMDYPINGQSPQDVDVTFSAQFNLDTPNVADGSNIQGEANFSETATLAGIEVVDANGNPVSGVTITSDSGTVYPEIVPEPGTCALIVPAALLWFVARWRLRRRVACPAAM